MLPRRADVGRMGWPLRIAAALGTLAIVLPAQAAVDTRARAVTIRLISVTTHLEVRKDVSPKNIASKGDVIWQRSLLRNAVTQFGKPKGATVGSDSGTLTLVSPTVLESSGTAVLPGGTVRFSGRSQGTTTAQTLSVTGGTGRYAGARGRLEVRPLGSGSQSSNVYRLTLP